MKNMKKICALLLAAVFLPDLLAKREKKEEKQEEEAK